MATNYEIRYASHPHDFKSYDNERIRKEFLIDKLFVPDSVNIVYSMYDRFIVGGATPITADLELETIDPLKSPFSLSRREIGIINVGGQGVILAGESEFVLNYKEAQRQSFWLLKQAITLTDRLFLLMVEF